jgi:hypothetical protein
MQAASSTTEPCEWDQLRPIIDDAIVELKNEEREAVVLRFFEKRSFAEIGATLRVTEEAARKRVDRALDRLRATLARRGVKSTASALGFALAANVAAFAPPGLGLKVGGQAFATANGATAGVSLGGMLGIVLPAAAVLMLGAIGIGLQRHSNNQLRAELDRPAAPVITLDLLRSENDQLARRLVEFDQLRKTASAAWPEPPRPAPPTVPTRPISAGIGLSPQGTISWNGEPINLAEFLQRLQVTKADPEARVHIQAPDAQYSALNYVIDEARKAGIGHVTVDSNATPEQKAFTWWF